MVSVNILVEGVIDEHVAKRLLKHVGAEVGLAYGKRGKPHLLQVLSRYNQADQHYPWFVIADLDRDFPCPSQALEHWLPNPSHGLRFRIAVCAIETWLMADRDKMAQFLAVPPSRLQHITDAEPNPKLALINIARRSRNSSIKEDIVPRQESGASVGPLYPARMIGFTNNHWRPEIAAQHSESLRRCLNALSTLRSWDSQEGF